jgi:CheY-like chemotaxis protein
MITTLALNSQLFSSYNKIASTIYQGKFEKTIIKLVNNEVVVEYFSKSDSDTLKQCSSDRFEGSLFNPLLQLLKHKLHNWPDPHPRFFRARSKTLKRLLLAPNNKLPLVYDVKFYPIEDNKSTEISIELLNTGIFLQDDSLESIISLTDISPKNSASLHKAVSAQTGMILVNNSVARNEIDALAILESIRPDAIIYYENLSPAKFSELLSLSRKQLIIISNETNDALSLLTSAFNLCNENLESLNLFCSNILLSFVHRRAKRVCESCAKETFLDSHTLNKVPKTLQPLLKGKYLFGRGCQECSHSAYCGTVGINSLLEVNLELVKILNSAGGVEHLARVGATNGLKCLLHDGIEKVAAHLTSIEEILAIQPSIPSAYEKTLQSLFSKDDSLFSSLKTSHSSRPKKILVVEDNQEQRELLELVFSSEGYQVDSAENGKMALTKLENGNIDLVVSDIMMPVMNGAELLRSMRMQVELAKIPVLMLTAISDSNAESSLLANGADDYCEKTVKKRVLLKRVENLLVRRPLNDF